MNIIINRSSLILLVVTTFISSMAQDKNQKKIRPKVGVVLSGGGAKGAAHVGVLKILEQLGIPVDYIGGTSVGAIVGGLYAIGYTPDEIGEIMKNMDFKKFSLNLPNRQILSKLNKQYYDKYTFSLPLAGIWNFEITKQALSNGRNLFRHLSKLVKNAIRERDFSKFKIPFLCVATDLVTGKEVVFKKGNLAEVLRASGSFPTVFSPFEINGRLMVDGGITNNFPASHVKNMGADILIGVDVQKDLSSKAELNSIYQILDQISSFRMAEKNKHEKKICDIIIYPDISGVGVMDLGKTSIMIDRGFLAARESEKLREIAYEFSKFQKEEPIQDKDFLKDSLFIDEFEVVGKTTFYKDYFKSKFNLNDNSRKFSFGQIQSILEEIDATNYFSHLSYDLYQNGNTTKFSLLVKEADEDTYLKFGINYNSIQRTRTLVNLTKRNLLLENSLLSFDWILEKNLNFKIDYRLISDIVSPGIYFLVVNYNFLMDRLPLRMKEYSKLRNNSKHYHTVRVGTYIEFEIPKTNIFLNLSGEFEYTILLPITHLENDTDQYGLIYDRNLSLKFDVERDTYDNKYFPKEGSYIYFLADLFYSIFKNKKQEAWLRGSGIRFRTKYGQVIKAFFKNLYFNYEFSFSDYLDVGNIKEYFSNTGKRNRFPISKSSGLGGSLSIGDNESFIGLPYLYNFYRIFGKLNMGLKYELFKEHYISLITDIGYIPYNNEALSPKWLYGLGISYGYDSVLGPINVILGIGKKDHFFNLNIGLNF